MTEGLHCTSCGFKLSEDMKFCPLCGQKKFMPTYKKKKEPSDIATSNIEDGSIVPADSSETLLCTHTYAEVKGGLYKDKYDSKNRLLCGICHNEFPRSKVSEKKEGMKGWQIATIVGVVLVFIFAAMSQDPTSQGTSGSYSYDLGYELGTSGEIGQMIFYGQAEKAKDACSLIVDISKAGTTTDGISWSSVDKDSFVKGCIAGYKKS